MKRISLFIILLLSVMAAEAQVINDTNFKSYEFEAGMGLAMGTNFGYQGSEPGLQFYVESRNNLKDTPWDIGFQVAMGVFSRRHESGSVYSNNKLSTITFVDYNFRCWKWVAPFVGAGLGMAMLDLDVPYINDTAGWSTYTAHSCGIALNPRVGVEFFDHLRLTVEYKAFVRRVVDAGGAMNNYFGVNLGFAFGGGRRK